MPRVRFIAPKPISVRAVRRAVVHGMQATAKVVRNSHELFTRTWDPSSRPEWKEFGPQQQGGAMVWRRETVSTPFIYVELGTRPHLIAAKNAPRLAFQVGFVPKTLPGRLVSGMGGTFGSWVFPTQVNHPGTAPRYINRAIVEIVRPVLSRNINRELAKL